MFQVGHTYEAFLNGNKMSFTVLQDNREGDRNEYLIVWSDGDEEWAYVNDLKRWTQDI